MPTHSKGGMQDHVLMLTEHLADKGHRVEVITTGHSEGRFFEERNNFRIHYLEGTKPESYFGGWWQKSIKKFEELHREVVFDVVHSQGAGGYLFLKNKINKKVKIPAIVSFHGTNYDEIKTQINLFSLKPMNIVRPILSILQQLYHYFVYGLPLARLSDGIIATSNEQAAIIENVFFANKHKIFKVFNGIDINVFTPLKKTTEIRQIYKLSSSTNFLLSIARLEKDKGIQNIIAAMPIILKELPDTKLMVVGDGGYATELKKQVKKLNLENNVLFTGMLPFESLPEYFNACDAFINPTIRQNGYDLTILEAMACEKPVVVSNIGSVPTVIEDGIDGILVPPGDIIRLSEAVVKVLKDKELGRRLGVAARRKVVEKFSVESMVEGTIKVYEEVIRRNKEKLKNK